MTKEEAKHIVDVAFCVPQAVRRAGEDRTYHEDEIREAKNMAIKALEQEPRKITLEDVKGYCKPRYLTVIPKELLYELTHQEPVLDKIREEIMSLDYIDKDKYEGTSIYPMIYRDDVLEIIDKYKAESEEE